MNANRLVKILILWFLFMAIIITASQIYEIVSNDKILDNEIVDVSGSENEPYNSDDSLLNLYLQIYAKNENNEYVQKTSDNKFLPVIDNLRYTETINLSTGNWFLYYKFELSMQDDVSLNNNESCYLTINGRDVRNFFISGTGNTEKDTYEYNLTLKNSSDVAVNLFNVYSTISEYENKFFDFENQSIIGIKYQTSNYRSIERIAAGIIFNRDINDTYKKNTAIFCAILFKENRDATGQNPALTYQIEVKNNSIKFNNIEHESEYYKNIYSLESNEFYQTGSTDNGENLFISNSQKIVEEWGEGKELATLKCSIGEYYDEEGNLAISTKQNDLPMLFDIGDLVIPYIAVADGKTEPLSIKLDGTPKVFKVTQIRPYFDGAFWQELILQEYYDNTYQETKTYSLISSSEENRPGSGIYLVEGNIEIEEKNVISSYVDDMSYEIHTNEEGQVIPYGTFWFRIIQNSTTSYTVSGTNAEPNAPSNLNIVVIYKK